MKTIEPFIKPLLISRFIPSMKTFMLCMQISLLGISFLLISATSPLEAKGFSPDSPSTATDNTHQAPRYSTLYDRVLLLEREEKYVEAMRIIPELYGEEFPVDTFYDTLEKKRHQLLDAASKKEVSFHAGKEKYTYSSLRRLFTNYFINKSDLHRQFIEVNNGELVVIPISIVPAI